MSLKSNFSLILREREHCVGFLLHLHLLVSAVNLTSTIHRQQQGTQWANERIHLMLLFGDAPTSRYHNFSEMTSQTNWSRESRHIFALLGLARWSRSHALYSAAWAKIYIFPPSQILWKVLGFSAREYCKANGDWHFYKIRNSRQAQQPWSPQFIRKVLAVEKKIPRIFASLFEIRKSPSISHLLGWHSIMKKPFSHAYHKKLNSWTWISLDCN